MHWQQLRAGCRLYNEAEDEGLLEDREKDYTGAIEGRDPVPLLGAWQRRLSYNKASLRRRIKQTLPNIDRLAKLRFETCPLPPIRTEVTGLFDAFDAVVKHTATSKVLHVLAPNLFVMWDEAIRDGYGLHDEEGTVWMLNGIHTFGDLYFVFLQRVQREAHEAVASYAAETGISGLEDAAAALRRSIYAKGAKSIAKLVDEFNIVKFTNGHPILWPSE